MEKDSALHTPHSALIRVLVVDDSSFMRAAVTHILKSDREIEVAGTADNGKEAVDKVRAMRPDVVLLDIGMPVMDGLTALSYIMAERPTPVVVLSGLAEKDARLAIKCLEHGAVDYIPKPSGTTSYDIDTLRGEIISKVKIAARVDVRKMALELPKVSYALHPSSVIPQRGKEVVVIGASTGGPRAVAAVLSGLRRDISAAIIVVQHMAKVFIPSFAERLRWESALDITVARDGEAVTPGRALIAPGGCDTIIEQDLEGRKITVLRVFDDSSPRTPNSAMVQSIDHTMEAAAQAYGGGVLGVLLTGVGEDGAKGMKAIKDAGGRTIAEDESTCIVYGMPKAAIEAGVVDEVVPLPGIAEAIMKRI